MKKSLALLFIFTITTFSLSALWIQVSATQPAHPPPSSLLAPRPSLLAPHSSPLSPQFLFTSRTSDSGLLNTSHQMVFGPLACTSNDDPYSPFNSPFRPPGYPYGPYTYRYRILIPPSYPHNSLRVELFDPDSYNAPTNDAVITHTSYAIANGFPAFENMDCINNGQGPGASGLPNACLLTTGEESLLAPPTVTIDQINPAWFMRVDENRGPAPGNCGSPPVYNVSYNTTTVYQLFYQGQSPNGSIQEVPLANYTGLRDNAHNTDLYWVSPGGAASFDGMSVPVDAGSPKSFELNLDTDIPDILVEPATGNRYIYLNVTTTGGSSKNGFDIWAGPATYTNSVPSQVNARNIHLLDNPNSHDSAGVVILASNDLPHSPHYRQVVERPLGYFGPEYAGQAISLTLFDVDIFSQAPITFTFDSIASADWSLTFGISGTIDPDGVPADNRCFPFCSNQFITPSYVITIPGGINCDSSNCPPFYGGRLLMQYMAGINDNHLVSLSAPPAPPNDPHIGCNALPIAVEYGIRAVNPPGTGTGNDYPAPGDFEYPIPPPSYTNFPNNIPDVPLQDAQEGYIYQIHNGDGSGTFAWLRWNNGINDSTTTLANSLIWPGNGPDYLNYGDGGLPATPLFPHVVRGYVNSLDTSDLDLHIGDWVIVSSSATNNTTVQDILNEHIDNGRLLRLPAWEYPPTAQGSDVLLHLYGFALFRLHGYNIGQPASWLLAEFIRWDDSCGQPEVTPPPSLTVTITGPVTSTLDSSPWPTFTAVVQPPTTTQPITYHWQATAQLPVTHTGGLSDTVTFRWPVPHTYTVSVTATNGLNTATDTHQIVIYPAALIPGCASFPISIQEAARSVFPPGTGSGNDYPAPGDFPLSSPQPLYLQFPNHLPDMPLAEAEEGYIFKLPTGFDSGNMAWLVWNNGINPSEVTLINSLTVPGDSTNYTNAGNGSVTPLYPFMVRGYVNPFDTVDLIMQPDDWVTVTTGSVNSAAGRSLIVDHIVNGRELSLPVWDTTQIQGSNVYARMVQFATFRLHGHNLSQGGGQAWLLVEFVRWETEICTEGQYPIGQININGPTTGITNVDYDFTATVVPTMTNQPITYTWEATGHIPFTQTAGITDTINLNWSTSGAKVITVTAENVYRVVTAVHTITLTTPPPLLNVTITGPVTGTANVDYAFTAAVVPTTTNQPITYTWLATDQSDITHTSGLTDTAVFQWPISGTKIITVTASNGLSTVTATHLITISQPVLEPITGITLTGPITGFVDTDYGFTAVVTPTTAAQPITYTWQATDHTDITHTSGLTDTAVFQWPISGTKIITVTASNGLNTVTATHLITISQPVLEPITGVTLTGPITGFVDTDYGFTAVITPTTATQPITYTWLATGQLPITHTGGITDVVPFSWNISGTQTITITADNGLNEPVMAVHTITIETIDDWLLYLPFLIKP